MGTNKTVIIVLIAIMGIGVAVFLWWSSNGEKTKHNWYENYKNDSKEPYGTFVISEVLEKYFAGKKYNIIRKPLHEGLPRNAVNTNYIFIGSGMYLDSLNGTKLLEFVDKGNNAFLSVPTIPSLLEETLSLSTCEYYYAVNSISDSIIGLNFYDKNFKTDPGYSFIYRHVNDTTSYSWYYILDTCISYAQTVYYYGNMNNAFPNYIRVPYGKGFFYFHTTPIAFTNLQLLNKRSLEYAGKVFSYLPEGDIYWDEFSKIPLEFKYEDNNDGGYGQPRWEKSPLYFILSQPALKFAWYLILSLVLLYLLFRAKRRQRIIPVVIPNTNTSLEFTETIGRIYYLQNDHKKLASQKMRLFLESLRNRYNISTNVLDAEFIKKLSLKSQVQEQQIKSLLEIFKDIEYSKTISETLLITFNQAIDNFYKKAK